MFSRTESAGWSIAVVIIVLMGVIALHGPFGHINLVHAGPSRLNSNTNTDQVAVRIVSDPKTIGRYVPATITAFPGQSIKFSNDSNAPHSVTDRNGAFNIQNIAEGDTSILSIPKPGVYHYYCLYHPDMYGVIRIKAH